MRRQFGDRKKDFVGPQTLFAWDLHSQWMQTLLQLFYGNKANSKKGLVRTAF